MYKLRYDEQTAAVWDSLPTEASEELVLAMADVCHDPYATTEPYNGNKERRTLALRHTAVALIVIDAPPVQRVYIRNIDYLG
ncbi:hypothetical protein [Streptomyces sp. TS71-3]|uniref:hypothetical protein n=1 Tax=Streptomyces sp. TS71-3 TaxID=2733862 RepID=UPI001B1068F6|nr:hypothetical protein [Streptomyces sp. TS71-3]GHJ36478.1 hypothetical protein Sm713_20870 [Streptomyces sp. TS71-3]